MVHTSKRDSMNAGTKRRAIVALSLSCCGYGAAVACASESTCAGWNCVAYVDTYPYAPYYTMDTYYDPVSNVYYAYEPPNLDAGTLHPRDGGTLLAGDSGTLVGGDGGDAGARTTRIPTLIAEAHDGATAINQGVHFALDPIRDLVKMTRTQTGDIFTFGPMTRGMASYEFSIRLLSAKENRFGWKLTARPASSSEAFALVAGGTITPADAPHTGTGTLGVDGDALSHADSSLRSRGKLRLGFASDSRKKVLKFALDGYTPDANATAPMNATAAGYTLDEAESALRVATHLVETEGKGEELVVIKVHSMKGIGTRADAIATGGNLDGSQALLMSTCVDQGLSPNAAKTSTKLCSADGTDCTQVSGPADLACPGGLQADDPAPSATADDAPQGMPVTPEVPATVPDGTE